MRVLAVRAKVLASAPIAVLLFAFAASCRALGENGERDTLSPYIVACLFIKIWPIPFAVCTKFFASQFKLFAKTLFLVEFEPGRTIFSSSLNPIWRLIGRFGPNSIALLHDCDGKRTLLTAEPAADSAAASKGL